ncbi:MULTISPECIES: DUF58 domain-containing protein [Variovorax]|jgi:uncharacterized protein (DUF58 family)|uniref:DUF58 domain-containing protein n=1 Tax=Variovorax TaxID=34072 RepID=UPI000869C704|nr:MULTISPECIES: DUF58 domain-containing protein [Variovorax]MBN8756865.1 DUF58 domain-containing protein [Variovorax sp.]ODU17099.1 MAG: hypothetical protein ABS94_10740 [Variovorax sp. SCN 67-85]ODV21610.1 MAG: hypothetical protein ABT25_22555 [Variovorax sp. SCN 67-20]OJZ14742.1 MAG: hypothetical protein BGP22_30220 [Variovorax sp. 67-131]UKI07054.1 DUF58 domain-containing protein [Variovorax paradoxus]
MRLAVPIPARAAVLALAGLAVAAAVALLLGVPVGYVALLAGALLALGLVFAAFDLWRSLRLWRAAPLRIERNLPGAFSLGVPTVLTLALVNEGEQPWRVAVFDELDAHFSFDGLPQSVTVPGGSRVALRYTATATRRGVAQFGATQLRWRTRLGCFEVRQTLGEPRRLRVYPNFAALARYAWLSGDRRLAQIGIKTYAQRGLGTDFRQLADYKTGDSLRHIDWKATQRQRRPIVREFQDDRDQCVLFLLDCGRRMRADEGAQALQANSHFDEALNALMLLSYVALKEGDEVGAMTFGCPPEERRDFAPRKGTATLNALMNRLHDIQPGATHSDYLLAAQELLLTQKRRALVIVLTNFRDEDATELRPAIKLLRRKHLVLVASLRERVLGRIANQPLAQPRDAVDVAAAHLFEQSRRDAFARVVGNDPLSVDVEPADLAVALVNRYHAVKRAGLL